MDQRQGGNPPGRMLFTDFDASQKGRPAASFAPGKADFLDIPIPSLDDLVSTLEIDFEDDEGDERQTRQRRPAAREEPEEKEKSKKAEKAGRHEEGERAGEPEESTDFESARAEPGREPRDNEIFPPDAGIEPDDNAIDEWLDSLSIGSDKDVPVAAGDFEPTASLLPEIDDINAADGAEDAVSPAAADRDREDDDVDLGDIMGSLSPGRTTRMLHRSGNSAWTGQRLGMPAPRQTPYGGIERVRDWYLPPEWAEESEEHTARRDNWYEAPEPVENSGEGGSGPDGGGAGSSTDAAADESPVEAHSATRRFRQSETEHLDRDEVAAALQMRRTTAVGKSDTTSIGDMFRDVDIDSLWAERSQRHEEPDDNEAERERRRLEDASMTQHAINGLDLLEADDQASAPRGKNPATENASTLILSSEDFLAGHGDTDVIKSTKKKRATTDSRHRSDSGLDPNPGFADNIEPEADATDPDQADTEKNFACGDDAAAASEETECLPEELIETLPVGRQRRSSGGRGDDLDVESLIGDVDLEADADPTIPAPVIDDSHISAIAKPLRDRYGNPLLDENGNVLREGDSKAANKKKAGVDDTSPDAEDENAAGDRKGAGGAERGNEGWSEDENGAVGGGPQHQSRSDSQYPPHPLIDGIGPDFVPEDEAGEEKAAADSAGETDGAGEVAPDSESDDEPAQAVNPMDVFANMDDMDFDDDDGLDDDMKAMLDDEEEYEDEEGGGGMAAAPIEEIPPEGWRLHLYKAKKFASRFLPMGLIQRLINMIAWRENWWFYLDILAAVIASGSIAIIISYFIWYR